MIYLKLFFQHIYKTNSNYKYVHTCMSVCMHVCMYAKASRLHELKARVQMHKRRLFGERFARRETLKKLIALYEEFDFRAKDASLIARDVFEKRLGHGETKNNPSNNSISFFHI
jgi:hypothetical protein